MVAIERRWWLDRKRNREYRGAAPVPDILWTRYPGTLNNENMKALDGVEFHMYEPADLEEVDSIDPESGHR